jgi:hypothetical protein
MGVRANIIIKRAPGIGEEEGEEARITRMARIKAEESEPPIPHGRLRNL